MHVRHCNARRGLVAAIAMTVAGTAPAATYTASTEAELIQAINDANTNYDGVADTISVTADITLTAELPLITEPLIIEGSGGNRAILRDNTGPNACSPTAKNAFRLIDAAAELTLSDLTLSGGCNLVDQGGAVRIHGVALTVTRSTISGNQTFFPDPNASCYGQCIGGGIAVLYGSANISDSTISDNMTNGYNASGGGIALFQSDLVMSRSAVSGNAIVGGGSTGGGGIYAYGYGVIGNISLADCTITGNAGSGDFKTYGGGLAAFVENVTISRSHIADNQLGNTSFGFGAGIHAGFSGTLDVRESSLTGNSVVATEKARAGAIMIAQQVAVTVTNSTLTDNSVDAALGAGGGIVLLSEDAYEASLVLRNSTVSGNSSSEVGGGIYLKQENSTSVAPSAHIESSIIAGNQGAGGLDAIGAEAATSAIVTTDHALIQGSADVGTGTLTLDATTLALWNQDPQLLPPAYNGGSTPTLALSPTSPAIGRGTNLQSLVSDQRGAPYARVVGTAADIGAYELDTDRVFANGFE